MSVSLVWITPKAQEVIGYCARVSNPANQSNHNTAPKLLKYCIKHKHWSPFEMASMCIEINTTRAISAQILRHKSFNFQEFSLRYAEALDFEVPTFRLQDSKNRQNSLDVLPDELQKTLQTKAEEVMKVSETFYEELLSQGVAKESARFVLPLATKTRLYMSGTIRSWIHYLQVRLDPSTQKEHRELAEQIKSILFTNCPDIAEAIFSDN
jgi:thymidylate synthase (FAD)